LNILSSPVAAVAVVAITITAAVVEAVRVVLGLLLDLPLPQGLLLL
jgi:hypothetical protein